MYVPPSPVVTERLTPVASLVNATVTPGTTPPETSRIVPTKSAVVTCACVVAEDRKSREPRTKSSESGDGFSFIAFLLIVHLVRLICACIGRCNIVRQIIQNCVL